MRSRALFLVVLGLLLPALANAATHTLPAEVKQQLDSLPDARTKSEYLEGIVDEHVEDPSVQFALGNAYFDLSQFEPAVERLRKATTLAPDYIEAWVNLGSVYDEMGRLDDALHAYKEALKLNPTEEKTLCNIGGVYFQKRQIGPALNHFQKAIDNHPDSQLAHYNLAILFADSRIYDEAIVEWQKVVDIDSESDLGQRSHDNIGIIQQMQELEVPAGDGDGHEGHSH